MTKLLALIVAGLVSYLAEDAMGGVSLPWKFLVGSAVWLGGYLYSYKKLRELRGEL